MLEKHQSVMQKDDHPVSAHDEAVRFKSDDGQFIDLALSTWEEMARPKTITLTVEVGDRLNG